MEDRDTLLGRDRRPLFTFAVVADTHVNAEEGQSSSPWEANRLANQRARAVADRIELLGPEFVIHLGDMVHPVPSQPGYRKAAKQFIEAFSPLNRPLHVIPGNHDVGDKPTAWSPATPITAKSLAAYRTEFGPDWHSFEHWGCRFVMINSQLLNSNLADETRQWEWLESEFRTGKRTFLFKHYPLFLHNEYETEHYDNIAEPARARLIKLIRDFKVEAVFSGHVHNFFYNRVGATDTYVLPATSAVRHDYSELFPVTPSAEQEFGRNASSKLGFFLVDVYQDIHQPHWIRTFGAADEVAKPVELWRIRRPSVRAGRVAPLGVEMRFGWTDPIAIPYTGAVDEFNRKRVRNDYIVASLWEMGLRYLRIPLQDITELTASKRIAELASIGHRFLAFIFGLPTKQDLNSLTRHAGHLVGLEVIALDAAMKETLIAAGALGEQLRIPIFISRLEIPASANHGERFVHFIRHGYSPNEVKSSLDRISKIPGLAGIACRIATQEYPWNALNKLALELSGTKLKATVQVTLAGHSPAQSQSDDAACACRVADTMLAAWLHPDRLSIFFDTFSDHDRGYFPRHGLIDRFCDSRPAGRVIRNLVELLHNLPWSQSTVRAHNSIRLIASNGELRFAVVMGADDKLFRTLATLGVEPLKIIRLDSSTSLSIGHAEVSKLELCGHATAMPLLIEVAPCSLGQATHMVSAPSER